jgi:hypothetical protein
MLEVRQSYFDRFEPVSLRIARLAFRSIAGRGDTPDLADPCDQSLAVAQGHRRSSRVG